MTQDNRSPLILVTGGHLTPAMATIGELRARFPVWRIAFIGRLSSLEGEKVESEEYRTVHALGIPFYPINAGRLKRDAGISALLSLVRVPAGFVQAFRYVLRLRPTVIVSFGGYIAFPVAIAGAVLGIPVVTHEQTLRPGLANRMIARVARYIAVSFPGTESLFGFPDKTIVTGLPVRESVLHPPKRAPFGGEIRKPMLLVVGGSTGSVSINRVVYGALPELLTDYVIIHQVGRRSIRESEAVKGSLPAALRSRYLPYPYLSPDQYSWALHECTLLIGRSGANTVTEAALTGTPAIWVPLPWAGNNEQAYNAQYLVSKGSSRALPQQSLTPKSLVGTVHAMAKEISQYRENARKAAHGIPVGGAAKLVNLVQQTVSARSPI